MFWSDSDKVCYCDIKLYHCKLKNCNTGRVSAHRPVYLWEQTLMKRKNKNKNYLLIMILFLLLLDGYCVAYGQIYLARDYQDKRIFVESIQIAQNESKRVREDLFTLFTAYPASCTGIEITEKNDLYNHRQTIFQLALMRNRIYPLETARSLKNQLKSLKIKPGFALRSSWCMRILRWFIQKGENHAIEKK